MKILHKNIVKKEFVKIFSAQSITIEYQKYGISVKKDNSIITIQEKRSMLDNYVSQM